MKTNEAITILEEVSLIDDSLYQYNRKYLEAFDMAIQALKNEQTDEDLISRQAVLDCLTATGLKKYDYILNARNKIKSLPSVAPQPKIGQIDGDLIAEIDKLPRIKVGNSNSPTVKYCIDEVLLYDLLEHYKKSEEE